ncbi:protease HtpX [Blochmannia endosymbiont of Camponotus (Colobopsis) obliquus]|uniref:protease HtpX n=1 Tax=Blochmannia endosymbiont of Camponotus (Colobopsis) obliquus TaxID=1505597 RepID=UPI00061A59F4|nr:protease HtpX [Blochmannia endosymbiont of Camponotus (Colobopsis) obliquus]AKC60604.1 protease HtpX [Blochmannia endosymbiont of Camponotus (Colobopsis) obliquus]
MFRIILFLLTNLAVMVVFGIVMSFSGIQSSSVVGLMVISGILGFSGAIISLMMSKTIALHSVNGVIIDKPRIEIERWLLQIVRYQSQQFGIVPPQIAIYPAINMNAFATGARRHSALIAVSTGLLQNMNRDEIEAVIAHEISHISSGDMLTMTLIQGIINTFVIFVSRTLAQIISNFISSHRDDANEKNTHGNSFVYFIISMILELVFGILANLIMLWFSRYREFYADAGSANLVGREKMIAALRRLKISCEPQESNSLISFCINGRSHSSSLSELFMSHPSLDKRIEVLRSGVYLNRTSIFYD